MENLETHNERSARISRLAAEMGRLFTPGHNVAQTGSYEAIRQMYLWEEHEKAEDDKFSPPEYSDHLFG